MNLLKSQWCVGVIEFCAHSGSWDFVLVVCILAAYESSIHTQELIPLPFPPGYLLLINVIGKEKQLGLIGNNTHCLGTDSFSNGSGFFDFPLQHISRKHYACILYNE